MATWNWFQCRWKSVYANKRVELCDFRFTFSKWSPSQRYLKYVALLQFEGMPKLSWPLARYPQHHTLHLPVQYTLFEIISGQKMGQIFQREQFWKALILFLSHFTTHKQYKGFSTWCTAAWCSLEQRSDERIFFLFWSLPVLVWVSGRWQLDGGSCKRFKMEWRAVWRCSSEGCLTFGVRQLNPCSSHQVLHPFTWRGRWRHVSKF